MSTYLHELNAKAPNGQRHQNEMLTEACAEVDRLRARVAALERDGEPKWQTMQTAPKDGTEIILNVPNYDPVKSFVGWWNKFEGCWWDGLENCSIGYTPTGWMPVPSALRSDAATGKTEGGKT